MAFPFGVLGREEAIAAIESAPLAFHQQSP